MPKSHGTTRPGPIRPHPDAALIAALIAIAIAAAAVMTRPDIPRALPAGLSIFGSVL